MAAGDELRELMRSFPSGVAVLSVYEGDEALAITVGSLVSLSLDPALVGVSIGVQSAMHEPALRADAFTLSLLGAGQASLAQHFARSGLPPLARWSGIAWRDAGGGRLLDGAVGWLECRKDAEYTVGDHTLVVGAVETVTRGPGTAPLVYVERAYRDL